MPAIHPDIQPSMPMQHLIEYIEQTHHAYTRDALARIKLLLSRATAAGMKLPQELPGLILALHDDLLPHLMKEEQVLFPYLAVMERQLGVLPESCFGSVANPIRMMQYEHEVVKQLLAKLRSVCADYVPRSGLEALYADLQALDADLVEHIRQEDEVLFPRALALEQSLVAEPPGACS